MCTDGMFRSIYNKKLLILPGAFTLGTLIWFILRYDPAKWNILFWNSPYLEMGPDLLTSLMTRALLMITSVAISIAFIVYIPERKMLISKPGARTMCVFLLHAFFLGAFKKLFPTWHISVFRDILILTFPIALVIILSLPFVQKIYDKTLNLISSILLVKVKPIDFNERQPEIEYSPSKKKALNIT
ncbi:hypothetical protein KHS38_13160 [Mucilaginibacter sp. Bleaf8]|nr:hypothetical protein [Mucilaginibacter sp. Bleaf8]